MLVMTLLITGFTYEWLLHLFFFEMLLPFQYCILYSPIINVQSMLFSCQLLFLILLITCLLLAFSWAILDQHKAERLKELLSAYVFVDFISSSLYFILFRCLIKASTIAVVKSCSQCRSCSQQCPCCWWQLFEVM